MARDREEVRFQVVSILEGKAVFLDGMMERLRAARERLEAEESPTLLHASEGDQDSSEGGRADCLEEKHEKGSVAAGAEARPGQQPLGSLQLQAAVRALLARQFAERRKLTIILSTETFLDCTEPSIEDWHEETNERLVRTCILPAGITLPEAEHIVARSGRKTKGQTPKPERACPALRPES
jgi:hypothetical protein